MNAATPTRAVPSVRTRRANESVTPAAAGVQATPKITAYEPSATPACPGRERSRAHELHDTFHERRSSTTPQTIAVTIEAERDIGAVDQHRITHGMQYLSRLRCWDCSAEMYDRDYSRAVPPRSRPPAESWCEAPAVPFPQADHLQLAFELWLLDHIGNVAFGEFSTNS